MCIKSRGALYSFGLYGVNVLNEIKNVLNRMRLNDISQLELSLFRLIDIISLMPVGPT